MSDTDKSIIPVFYLDAVQLGFKSEQEGRPIFEDREFVKILIAGDGKTEVNREVTQNDRQRWPEAYSRFKQGLQDRDQIVGTPLAEWPVMTPADIRNWHSVNVFTVEQLASLSDTALQTYGMGARETQTKARAYLEQAKDTAAVQAHAAENERLRAENEQLRADLRALAQRIDAVEQKKGRAAA